MRHKNVWNSCRSELATVLVNLEASADTNPSTELAFVKSALTTFQAEADKAQDQLTLL